jgi:hypothetical protein
MKSISEFLYVAGAVLIAGPGDWLLVEDEQRTVPERSPISVE